jgi:hypothetical protein
MNDYDLGAGIGGVIVAIPTLAYIVFLLVKETRNEKAYDNKKRELGVCND